ncbi:acyl-CoA dehydrogenase family protein [Pseudonocardia acidicola]|uniref:Oxidoreductase n=1 Tax=Pseudonocardia acidicola TaxID=2724939 RepID=A0ABX1SHQ8_9PSEU|nr:acyl-CoA dehydrogenase family protein [Pseudonocardia acidicola]NMI00009.1 oxidoreductase [Pseudonocardia acidicola]
MSIILDRPSATDVDRELRADLVGRATKLVPLLAANAQRSEDDRRVVEENITAIEEAGLFSIMRPKRFGGLEVDFRTKLEVSRELARGCGSTSWVTTLMNVCAWFTGLFGEQAQQDVWGEHPGNRVAGVLAPTAQARAVDGGYVVTGKWGWASGSAHSQWALVGIPILGADGEVADQKLVLVPMSDLTIEDTWFVAGMKGTASNTLVADEIFVPEHRCISVVTAIQGEVATPFTGETLYRSAFVPVAALVLAGPQLGLAQAALDLVIEKAPKRSISYTFYGTQTEAPTVQLALAKAASLIDSAHLHAYRAAAEIDDAAHRGVYPDYDARALVRMDTGAAVTYAREAIRTLMSAHGASSFAESSPLQRIWRDSETASRHAVVNPEISTEVYGTSLLGIRGSVTALV